MAMCLQNHQSVMVRNTQKVRMKSPGQLALSSSLAAGGILSHSARMLPSDSNINLSRVSMLHTKRTVLQSSCFLWWTKRM
ncbi:hypothetical protein BCL69_101022 [Nitrosomonas communis]|uniref:Uncharacterized protein n=1 Tax=Nitrosomonas communis TaxID=44574 RepID=A0A5D3YE32_9PROT|nr:hypothetical protein BCL69_101022 [Nitrosomonas communis]